MELMYRQPTPIVDFECGKGWQSHLVARAIAEPNELCSCGMLEGQTHTDDCDEERARRFDRLRNCWNRKTNYIELEVK